MRSIRNCPVAVVGACGFLGSHAVDHLIEDRGCDVLAIDNLIAGRREFLHPAAHFEHADITGSETHLRKLFQTYNVRYCFNYAAWPYVPTSFERPLHVFSVNAFGALQVINAAQEAGCEGIAQVSSAEIYGAGQYGGVNHDPGDGQSSATVSINEDAPVCPHSSYGASKAAIDAMVQVRWREAKTPCIALRQFNCTGERNMAHPYVIPAIYRQLREWQRAEKTMLAFVKPTPVVRLGNNSTRDFLYAGDAVRMAVELLEKGNFGEVYNSGSGESICVYELARLMGKLMGCDDVEVVPDAARVRPWEIWHLQADCTKLFSAIDYRPRVGLEEALRRTISYFDAHADGWAW